MCIHVRSGAYLVCVPAVFTAVGLAAHRTADGCRCSRQVCASATTLLRGCSKTSVRSLSSGIGGSTCDTSAKWYCCTVRDVVSGDNNDGHTLLLTSSIDAVTWLLLLTLLANTVTLLAC
jgi:hypothetical protein